MNINMTDYKMIVDDEVYNNIVDAEVLGWMPLPEPYRESEG